MKNATTDLAAALRERLAIVRDEESRRDVPNHMARLQAVSQKIDRLAAAMAEPVDPQLRHYLERRSYDKALEFLDGYR
jgi:heme oxygenase